MMRKLTIFLFGLLTLTLASCTHNNGNIGDWFGTWHVSEMTVNGEPATDYQGNMFFLFQANICNIITTYPHNASDEHFARFREEGNNTILIDFSYTDEWNPIQFEAPAESQLENGPNILKVHSEGTRKKMLTLEKDNGTIITYTLKKQ